MKKRRKTTTIIFVLSYLMILLIIVSCGSNTDEISDPVSSVIDAEETSGSEDMPDMTPIPTQPVETTTPQPIYPGPDIPLVPNDDIVEHIFFHEIIAYPEKAFDGDRFEKNYDDYMVTVSEFNAILESLHRNNYILVNMNDVWSEYTDDNGEQRMRRNTLMLPEGKKPLIISFDDINFYEYMTHDGFMEKLIIGEDGEIWAQGTDPNGERVISQELAAVPVLDRFIRENPDFSMYGVKGCIALTGYEGILGYRTQTDANNDTDETRLTRMREIARVSPVIERLKQTGWYFASHSYGHVSTGTISYYEVVADANRWMEEVGSLIGETRIFIYPYGSRLDGSDVYETGPAFRFYHDLGFRYFASVGYESYSRIKPDIGAIICDRISIDGIRLRGSRTQYLRFYDVIDVFDPLRPSQYGTQW